MFKINKQRSWQKLLRESIGKPEVLSEYISIDSDSLNQVVQVYPMRINAYFLDLMIRKGKSLIRQVVPDPLELEDSVGLEDPLLEAQNSPVPHLIHRYSDRALLLVSSECAVYCRFCTRKRRLGKLKSIPAEAFEEGFHYIRQHREIRDVLLSGGDPLLLLDDKIEWILSKVRAIQHVDIIRIGTRVPSVLPQRITSKLVSRLKKYHPLYMNIHFNHPDEITDEAAKACWMLADGGISLGSQTVLLRGINDNPDVMVTLMKSLLKLRIRPYYLLQCDLVKGTNHFRTRIESGVRIIAHLRKTLSGLGVPTYIIDLPKGGGKVAVLPDQIVSKNTREWVVKNDQGKLFSYPQSIFDV